MTKVVLNCSAWGKSGFERQALSGGIKSPGAGDTGLGELGAAVKLLEWRWNFSFLHCTGQEWCVFLCVRSSGPREYSSSVCVWGYWTDLLSILCLYWKLAVFILLWNAYFVPGRVCEEKELSLFPFFLFFPSCNGAAPMDREGIIRML